MKITRKQLSRLVRKEHARLMKESLTDMMTVEEVVDESAGAIADEFAGRMEQLFAEDPGIFDDRSTKDEWLTQVSGAATELELMILGAVDDAIQEVEAKLHSGDFATNKSQFQRGDRRKRR